MGLAGLVLLCLIDQVVSILPAVSRILHEVRVCEHQPRGSELVDAIYIDLIVVLLNVWDAERCVESSAGQNDDPRTSQKNLSSFNAVA